jgi:FKBP-type peptidyl-prolyl cis-trans isomerase FklB
MESTKEKASYCIGLVTGSNLRGQFADLDITCTVQGMQDALHGETPKLEKEEISTILQSINAQVEQQNRENFKKVSETNKARGNAFLDSNKKQEGVVALPSGLQYKVLSQGNGEGPLPSPFDMVKIHYKGFSIDGRILDSSHSRGGPATIPVNQAIGGWSEALQKMHVGDKWKIFVPSYLAYGSSGVPPHIEPDMTIVFELELLEIHSNTKLK